MTRIMSYLLLFLTLGLSASGMGFNLPVERHIEGTDHSGKTWQEEGSMPVSLTAARQMWEVALRREGWFFIRNIPLEPVQHKQLDIWGKDSRTLILCVWEIAPGRTGYMWGIANQKNKIQEAK